MYLALIDLQANFGFRQDPFIVMVVGAGRGPLVRASLRASERANIAIFVYALDKNPNAVVTLRQVKAEGRRCWVPRVPEAARLLESPMSP